MDDEDDAHSVDDRAENGIEVNNEEHNHTQQPFYAQVREDAVTNDREHDLLLPGAGSEDVEPRGYQGENEDTANEPGATLREVEEVEPIENEERVAHVTVTPGGIEAIEDHQQGAELFNEDEENGGNEEREVLLELEEGICDSSDAPNNVEEPQNPANHVSPRYNLRPKPYVNYLNLHKDIQMLQHGGKIKNKNTPQLNDDVHPSSTIIKTQTQESLTGLNEKSCEVKVRGSLHDVFMHTVDFCFNQMSARKGLIKHGEKAAAAILKEFTQLHDMKVFEGIYKDELTPSQLKDVLRLLTVIKEKRDGKLKGRTCADGRPQRAYISREEASSPAVAVESLLATLVLDANEKRDVATADVSGAFLHGEMEDFVVVRLSDEEATAMIGVDSSYERFLNIENGKKTMYLKLKKALYGTLKAAIIWYNTFTGVLKELGFVINRYEKCVANMCVKGSQATIVWHVDDAKISHKDPEVVSWILGKIKDSFGSLSITRGSEHAYVGMDFRFPGDGSVHIMAKDYIKEAIQDFGEDVSVGAMTPAGNDLFTIKDEENLLPKTKGEVFHSIIGKLLFITKRSRPDITLTIAFLCTRVSKSTHGDWEKLRRLLKYLYRTMDMPRILKMNGGIELALWADASFACHHDMKSHTGMALGLGGAIIATGSSKQKLVTRSSTEAELVGASDTIAWSIWLGNF